MEFTKCDIFRDKKILYISPHLDDAVLSSGGVIRIMKRVCKELVILNVFSKSKWSIYSNIEDYKEITKIRKEENELYGKKIHVQMKYGEVYDSSLRGYTDETELLAHVREDDTYRKVKNVLLSELINNDYDIIFCPLAIGGHIDHKLIRYIMEQLNPTDIYYFEDLPYATHFRSYEIIEHCNMEKKEQLFFDISLEIENKLQDITLYQSQLEPDLIESIRSYSLQYNHYVACEGVWREKI